MPEQGEPILVTGGWGDLATQMGWAPGGCRQLAVHGRLGPWKGGGWPCGPACFFRTPFSYFFLSCHGGIVRGESSGTVAGFDEPPSTRQEPSGLRLLCERPTGTGHRRWKRGKGADHILGTSRNSNGGIRQARRRPCDLRGSHGGDARCRDCVHPTRLAAVPHDAPPPPAAMPESRGMVRPLRQSHSRHGSAAVAVVLLY